MRRRDVLALAGGAAAWPLGAWPVGAGAQTGRVPRVGELFVNTAERERQIFGDDPFGLAALGYVEGKTILIERRFADGQPERMPKLAADLVAAKVDLIIAVGESVLAAHDATRTIPIVTAGFVRLVELGLADSLAHPGKNVTGTNFSTSELYAKRLELLKQIVPSLSRVGILTLDAVRLPREFDIVNALAGKLNVELQPIEVVGKSYAEAFAAAGSVEAMILQDNGQFFGDVEAICSLALARRLPLAGAPVFAALGALIAYGVNVQDLFRRVGWFADKILKGAKPGEIPIEFASRFEVAVNLKTARTLGLEIPPSLLAAANAVFE